MLETLLILGFVVVIGATQSRARRRNQRELRHRQGSTPQASSQPHRGNHNVVGGPQRGASSQRQATATALTETYESLSNEVASQIAKRKQIEYKLITRRFHEAMKDQSNEPNACSICITEFKTGEEISQSVNSQCPHLFHTECIVDWLVQRSGCACPVCRRDFLPPTLLDL